MITKCIRKNKSDLKRKLFGCRQLRFMYNFIAEKWLIFQTYSLLEEPITMKMSSLIYMFVRFFFCCCWCYVWALLRWCERRFNPLQRMNVCLRMKFVRAAWSFVVHLLRHSAPDSHNLDYLVNICEKRIAKNDWIWFITYWVGRQSNEITFWNEEEILNANDFFFFRSCSTPVVKFISCNCTNGFLNKNHSTFVFAFWYVFLFLFSSTHRFTNSRCGISFRSFSRFGSCFYALLLLPRKHECTFPVLFVVNHFQWAPDLLIPKRNGAKMKWNLRECYYVIKNILNELLWESPKWFGRTVHKKGWHRLRREWGWEKKLFLQTEFEKER